MSNVAHTTASSGGASVGVADVSPRLLRVARVGGVAATLAFIGAMVTLVVDRAAFAIDLAVFHLGGRLLRSDGYDAVYDRDLFRSTLEAEYRPDAELGDSLTYFISPPPFAWVSQLISLVPFDVAVVVWLGLGAVALVVSTRLLDLPLRSALVFAFTPAVVMNTAIGQSGLFFVLLAVLVHRAIVADKPVVAGLLVGLFILKPPLAIGWALWWLLDWKRWTPAVLGALTSSSLLILPTVWSGTSAWTSFIDVMAGRVDDESSLQVNSMSVAEFIKLLAPNAPQVVTFGAWAIAAVGGMAAVRFAVKRWGDRPELLSAAAIVVTVGASPHLSVYDTGLLLIPCAVLVRAGVASFDRLTLLWAIYVGGLTFGPVVFALQYDIAGRGVGLEFPALVALAVLATRWLSVDSVPILANASAVDGEREDLIISQ